MSWATLAKIKLLWDLCTIAVSASKYLFINGFLRKQHYIRALDKKSFITVSSDFLKNNRGSIAIWVWFFPNNNNIGIRTLGNHSYVIAHDTNNGDPLTPGKYDYQNGFGFLLNKRNEWEFWISDNKGSKYQGKTFPDSSSEIKGGWNLLVIRWNHTKPVLEILVNGNYKLQLSDYHKYWPTTYNQHLFIGTWQSKASMHYIDTYVTQPLTMSKYISDFHISIIKFIHPQKP